MYTHASLVIQLMATRRFQTATLPSFCVFLSLLTAATALPFAQANSRMSPAPLAPPQIKVDVPVVMLDVSVMSKDGLFIPGLKREHFRVLEDGVPQTITSFSQSQAPITAVLLTEFANSQFFYSFQTDSINTTGVFTSSLKKEDWVALISYDIRPHILQDFTQDKRAIYGGLALLQPGMTMSAETNLFDALYDTIDRLESIEGRKCIILVSSGRDTFSKKTLDQVLKKVQGSRDISIYAVGTGQSLREYAETHGLMKYLCPITSFTCSQEFLQADNQLKSFARMTGGRAYFPIFNGQLREIFAEIAQAIHNQYSISYSPTNRAQDGSFRKIIVELVDDTGKVVKYQVIVRDGYKAKQAVP